jgi:catechol 2,3-dioxygenase-like lactoylglutathione lyase family enzyme
METFIAQMLNQFESGKINRRELVRSIAVAAATLGAGGAALAHAQEQPAARTPAPKTPAQMQKVGELQAASKEAPLKATQVSHFRYTCKDYKPSRDYYQEVMGWRLVPGSDKGEGCTLAFYDKGVTPVGQTKGTPSGYVVLRNGWTPPTPPPPDKPNVTFAHIAYTVQFDKPLPNGKATWDKGSKGTQDGPLETMRNILTKRGLTGIREDTDCSFHVKDPTGYDLQISGVGMNGYDG